MRKQYYFRESDRGLLAWDVDRLVELSRGFPRKRILLSEIRELDQPWAENGGTSWRSIIEHMQLISEADLSYPIILAANGDVMDGRHRIAKAALEGRSDIEAVQFETDPEPDHVGVETDDLPYYDD